MSKKLIGMLIAGLLIAMVGGMVCAAQPISILVNGTVINSDTPPQIVNNRTMVPIGVIAQSLGAEVSWDAANNRVLITTKPAAPIPPAAPVYKLLKLNGEATTWPYWVIDGKLYMEQRNLCELVRIKKPSPFFNVSYSPAATSIVINSYFVKFEPRKEGDFVIIPLDPLVNEKVLSYSFDAATGNLTIE